MAITISQDRKKQRYLILALTLLIFAALLIVWLNFLKREQISEPLVTGVIYAVPKIEIDWQILDDLRGKTFRPLEGISAFDGDFGRKNPFVPY